MLHLYKVLNQISLSASSINQYFPDLEKVSSISLTPVCFGMFQISTIIKVFPSVAGLSYSLACPPVEFPMLPPVIFGPQRPETNFYSCRCSSDVLILAYSLVSQPGSQASGEASPSGSLTLGVCLRLGENDPTSAVAEPATVFSSARPPYIPDLHHSQSPALAPIPALCHIRILTGRG